MSHWEDYRMTNPCKGDGQCADPHCSDHGRLNPRSSNYAPPPRKDGSK
jgi:hypothetical protein